MISAIVIENFQSHAATEISLHEHINVIVGQSDSGKSAIMRAINVVCLNSPDGTDYVSNWIKTKGGSIKAGSKCSIAMAKDGVYVERFRDGSNGYKLGKEEFTAIGKDVPAAVETFLNVDDINFQNQFDAPFLLGLTSGEVARYLNKIVNLSTIDEAQSMADSNKRETDKEIKRVKEGFVNLRKEVEKYGWVSKAAALCENYAELESKFKTLEKQKQEMGRLIGEIRVLEERIRKAEQTIKAGAWIDKILLLQSDLGTVNPKIDRLSRDIYTYTQSEKTLRKSETIKEAESKIKEIERLSSSYREKEAKVDSLISILNNFKQISSKKVEIDEKSIDKNIEVFLSLQKRLVETTSKLSALSDLVKKHSKSLTLVECLAEDLEELEKQMPSRCPVCNNTLSECKD